MTNVDHFIEIGIALASEKNHEVLLEKILLSAKDLAHADGGTIYSITAQSELKFETIINDSLDIHLGGTTKKEITFPNIPIYINDETNHKAMAAEAAGSGNIINIEDAYLASQFDTGAARAMDERTGYRTQSVLTLPMTDHQGELNGVLQLINAKDSQGNTIVFSQEKQKLVHSLSALAAVVLTNKQLIIEMENLFSSFSKLIAKAIDKKSPYTGGHCRRVPEITMLLAHACDDIEHGPLADFSMSAADFHELSVAAWLHDCGKVATPESVMDKATKLHTIFDRIDLIDARFEVASRDIAYANHLDDQEKTEQLLQLDDDRDFLRHANKGGEFFSDKDVQRVHDIANRYCVTIAGVDQAILNENEIYNLVIAKGTLTEEERKIINGHMDITVEMLESMQFPKHLARVPEYACGHHEKMDGTGYPKGLMRDQMSKPARMMAIADVFEALTAADRPYKQAKTLLESLTIMGWMRVDNHLDPELFDVFIDQKVYQPFADKFLLDFQKEAFDLSKIPGYVLPELREKK